VISDSAKWIIARTKLRPRIAVVLGSGLGGFADELIGREEFPYTSIPHWPASTAVGHAGKLIFGLLGTLEVAVMGGRAHLYEGYSPAHAVLGVRVLGELGVRAFIFTNAAGGINAAFEPGTLALISDHINLQGSNPLVGPNDESLGPRFPDMTEAYSRAYRETAKQVAHDLGIRLGEGVYAAVLGPSYETPAEIRYLRAIGADMVGMSTVAEVIAANHLGARCLGISCVTNMAAGVLPRKLDHAEVLETGAAMRGTLGKLLQLVIPRLEI
jgi:purine-nucleoside phosphorylase